MYCRASATDWTRSSWRIDTGWRGGGLLESELVESALVELEAAGWPDVTWLGVTMRTQGDWDADFSPRGAVARL